MNKIRFNALGNSSRVDIRISSVFYLKVLNVIEKDFLQKDCWSVGPVKNAGDFL